MLTRVLIGIVALNTVLSQLLLKRAMDDLRAPDSLSTFPAFVMAAAVSPWVYASLVLQVVGYVLWMVVISQQKLGVSVALLGAGFYVLMPLATWFVFGERLGVLQWAGMALIMFGVLCVTLKPV